MSNPLEQFRIKQLGNLHVPGTDIPFTNSAMFMLLSAALVLIFLYISTRKKALVPTRGQATAENVYNLVESMAIGAAGPGALRYMPIIFTVFIFILAGNLLGMLPYSFTITSHISLTFAIAFTLFTGITLLGFYQHGLHYLSLFLPKGTPIIMAPLMIVIELFAYFVRPVSLSIRLAANMTAGHIVMKVLASFVIMAKVLGFLPFALLTVVTGFEIFIAVLQAYIFTILTCAYLNDALNLH